MADFDVAVIGRGMIGSAAGRHLAMSGCRVALVGPDEPSEYTTSTGPFASHFDQGRVTRITASDPVWAELAVRSINRYDNIAEQSGIMFHEPRGLAFIGDGADDGVTYALERGGEARLVTADWLHHTTGIVVPTEHHDQIAYEGPPAGLVKPLRLVEAQTVAAERHGASVVRQAVTGLERTGAGFSLAMPTSQLSADRVLLATGAYGASLAGVELDLERRLRTVVMAELGAAPELPSLILDKPDHDALDEIYWVPPLAYPDGRVMLKIGGDSIPMSVAETHADIARWFHHGGSPDEARSLQEVLQQMLPRAEIRSWMHKPCVVTYTTTSRPYVGFVDDGVVVALGGSGAAAKSSDEIGRLGARLLTQHEWTDTALAAHDFAPQTVR